MNMGVGTPSDVISAYTSPVFDVFGVFILRDQTGPIQGLGGVIRNLETRQITQCRQQIHQRYVSKTATISRNIQVHTRLGVHERRDQRSVS